MSKFATPIDFCPGALNRDIPCGQIPGVPVFGDVNPVLPEKDWLDAIRDPNRPQLSKRVWTVLNQGSVGSCASETVIGAAMLVRALANRAKVLFNPYATYGRVNGGSDSGSSLSGNLAFAREFGCFPESIWPRSKGWRPKPSDSAFDIAANFKLHESYDVNNTSRDQFFNEMFSGLIYAVGPCQFGYPGHSILGVGIIEEAAATPEMIECADTVDQWLVAKGYQVTDNPTGLVDTLYIEYLNSWGDWGNKGFGYVRASRVERNYGCYFWRSMIESTWVEAP